MERPLRPAAGRGPPPLRVGVLPALVVVAQMTSNKLLEMHAIMFLQMQKSLILLASAAPSPATMRCRPARVLVALELPLFDALRCCTHRGGGFRCRPPEQRRLKGPSNAGVQTQVQRA